MAYLVKTSDDTNAAICDAAQELAKLLSAQSDDELRRINTLAYALGAAIAAEVWNTQGDPEQLLALAGAVMRERAETALELLGYKKTRQ